jgi:hypothetical protein
MMRWPRVCKMQKSQCICSRCRYNWVPSVTRRTANTTLCHNVVIIGGGSGGGSSRGPAVIIGGGKDSSKAATCDTDVIIGGVVATIGGKKSAAVTLPRTSATVELMPIRHSSGVSRRMSLSCEDGDSGNNSTVPHFMQRPGGKTTCSSAFSSAYENAELVRAATTQSAMLSSMLKLLNFSANCAANS